MVGFRSLIDDTKATVRWTDVDIIAGGNSPIINFAVACNPATGYPGSAIVQIFAASTACTGSSCTTGNSGFGGLTTGTPYSCTVTATNAAGGTSVPEAKPAKGGRK